MKYKKVLITGGAGFVGSNVCLALKKEYSDIHILALDNLRRRGSELNVARLADAGVDFVRGDVRNPKDLDIKGIDLIIECSAEPSVMAGVTSSPQYAVETNLVGAINCFEMARKNNSDVIFISTSRVYPIGPLNNLKYKEESTRFSLTNDQTNKGASKNGINEEFPLSGIRTIYGA